MIKALKVLEFGKNAWKDLEFFLAVFSLLSLIIFWNFVTLENAQTQYWFSCLTSLFKIHQSCNLNHFELTVYYKHHVYDFLLISHAFSTSTGIFLFLVIAS
jgi:hypothetical protein